MKEKHHEKPPPIAYICTSPDDTIMILIKWFRIGPVIGPQSAVLASLIICLGPVTGPLLAVLAYRANTAGLGPVSGPADRGPIIVQYENN